ncbi:DNA-binding CsgD family transcriptional regulator/tetratricopeptide (TPR) repeat protein [Nocardioides cavernae]|uniref:DNA-binding CsgD family transcriptional regulator/tetratricopeptide (TPR) repeat protein n=1 Tax=Nocardioides cavernae TaxID=1921566 RepID=A0A7Y9KP75_9ACTN|nr:LuxR family transcriptional regulator [Nocardioides cavernae]NYE36431.1 DNA-binding CsgD family transcriptional regulator/tetratricopeptide (TPR) repeat protein [Nocardioides cavernae]
MAQQHQRDGVGDGRRGLLSAVSDPGRAAHHAPGALREVALTMHHSEAPRLLERERELDVLREGVRQVRDGLGVGIAVAGESGTGKSSAIAAVVREAAGLRVLRGQCDPLGTPRPLGPFRDLGMADLLARASADEVHLSETAGAVLRELAAEPTVLVVEDLHWADAASTDVLRHVVRRVETVPVAVLVSYRDLEIGPRHPARRLLGDFAALDGLRTLALRPLSVDGVATAVDGSGLDPVRVHALTGGNPFYVAQVAQEPDRPLPDSVRDTILARTADLEPEDLETLQLIACSPDGLDDRLLPLVGVDLDELRRLDRTTLLVRTEHGIAFRHELARQAVETTIPPGGAPRLHHRLLVSLEQVDLPSPATLTHHALGARDAARTLVHAREAASEAVAAGSNAEAAAFLEVALDHLPGGAPSLERAQLLMQLAQQLYVTARLPESAAATRAAIPLWRDAGRLDGVAEAHAVLNVLEYQSGRRASSNRHAAQAQELADGLDSPETVARVHADAGMVALVNSDLARAVACGRRTTEAGAAAGSEEHVLAGRLLVEGVACICGEPGARERVAELVGTARRHGWDETAWRGYIMLTIHAMDRGELRTMQRVVEETLVHTHGRDLRNATLWHLSLRAILHARAGRWSAAREDAEEVLASGACDGSIWPHVALATAALRVGDQDPAPHLEQAWRLARTLDEPGRYLPVLSCLAEAMWLSGTPDDRVTTFAVEHLPALCTADQVWPVGDLVLWLRRVGIAVEPGPDLPVPHRASLERRTAEVATWWQRSGNVFDEAMAYADSPDAEDRVRGVVLLDRLGAIGTADRLRRELRRDGLASVPSRPIESTRANPGGLTNRQLEVARLVARGHTNSEIAAQTFISTKTAEHHVSAILAKLQVANRRELLVRAGELGLD